MLESLPPCLERTREVTRRQLFQTTTLSVGAIALECLLRRDGYAALQTAAPGANPLTPKEPMIAPRAKRVIYLHMAGSPSQLELFDHKPELEKLHLQDAPQSFLEGKRFAFIKGVPKVLAGQFQFAPRGQSGQLVSELLPHLSKENHGGLSTLSQRQDESAYLYNIIRATRTQ